MSVSIDRWLQDKPLIMPAKTLKISLDFHTSPGMVIMVSNRPMDIPASCHSHEAYEFFTAVSSSAYLAVEGEEVCLGDGRILAINSGQEHGTTEPLTRVRFLILKVDRQLVQSLAKKIYGSSRLEFCKQTGIFNQVLWNLVSMFIHENNLQQPGYRLIMQQLSGQILIHLLRQLQHNMPMTREERPCRKHRPEINRVIDLINECYNTDLSLEEMARIANLSPFHFIRVFKAQTGKTPYEYLLNVKIERACYLLKNRRYSITEVAYHCGFSNPSHFSKIFMNKMGLSPNRYRMYCF